VSSALYVFGGIDDQTRQQDLHQLDLTTLRWVRLNSTGDIPSARSGIQAGVVGEEVYFFGGYTKKNGEYFNDLYRFNPSTGNFEEVTTEQSPPPRTDHTLVTYGGSLYIFAGYAWSERLNDLWEFRISTRTWRQLNGGVSPDPRFGHTASVHHDKMLIFGGWNGHETLSDLWTFNFTTSLWVRFTTSGFIAPRYRHTSIMCGNSLFVFGGVNKDQVRFSDVFELNIGLRHWMKVETRGQGPSPRTFHRAIMF
jgi:N-acetylneuraminic acid mutarotase